MAILNSQQYEPMSVKEARKRLGRHYTQLSDEQVEYLVKLLSDIARQTVKNAGSKNLLA